MAIFRQPYNGTLITYLHHNIAISSWQLSQIFRNNNETSEYLSLIYRSVPRRTILKLPLDVLFLTSFGRKLKWCLSANICLFLRCWREYVGNIFTWLFWGSTILSDESTYSSLVKCSGYPLRHEPFKLLYLLLKESLANNFIHKCGLRFDSRYAIVEITLVKLLPIRAVSRNRLISDQLMSKDVLTFYSNLRWYAVICDYKRPAYS